MMIGTCLASVSRKFEKDDIYDTVKLTGLIDVFNQIRAFSDSPYFMKYIDFAGI